MKKFIKERIIPNIWRLIMVSVMLFTAFFIGRTCLTLIRTYAEIRLLEADKRHYMQSIAEDSVLLERLKYDEYLEEYARENFNMRRRNEHVYIIKEK